MEEKLYGLTVVNTVLPAAMLLLGAGVTWVISSRTRRQDAHVAATLRKDEEERKWKERVADLEMQLKVLKEAVTPISMAFQQVLIKELTHFHEVRTDELLAKIGPPYRLTDVEEKELCLALEKRIDEAGDLMTEAEIDAARMLPMLMKRVKAELAMGIGIQDTEKQGQDLQLVTVPTLEPNGPTAPPVSRE